jgi:hypothetical protein
MLPQGGGERTHLIQQQKLLQIKREKKIQHKYVYRKEQDIYIDNVELLG